MHVLHTQIAFILQSHYAQQVVRCDSAEGQSQTFDGVEGVCFARFLVDEVVDVGVELNDVVAVEGGVAVDELEVGVGVGEAEFHDFFVLEEGELFECFFEMLDLAENLS